MNPMTPVTPAKRFYFNEVATGFQNEACFVATDDKVARLDALGECGNANIAGLLVPYPGYQCITPLIQPVAVYGPNSLSADLQGRLSLAIRQVVKSENFRKRAEDQGAHAIAMDGPELAALGASERNMWSRVIKRANIKAD